jgi:prevent-host-death family protein
MASTLTAAKAKAEFAECVRRAEAGESVVITRHGKPVAALVSSARLDELERLRSAGPSAGLASVLGGWAGSDDLVAQLSRIRRSRSRRPVRPPR